MWIIQNCINWYKQPHALDLEMIKRINFYIDFSNNFHFKEYSRLESCEFKFHELPVYHNYSSYPASHVSCRSSAVSHKMAGYQRESRQCTSYHSPVVSIWLWAACVRASRLTLYHIHNFYAATHEPLILLNNCGIQQHVCEREWETLCHTEFSVSPGTALAIPWWVNSLLVMWRVILEVTTALVINNRSPVTSVKTVRVIGRLWWLQWNHIAFLHVFTWRVSQILVSAELC